MSSVPCPSKCGTNLVARAQTASVSTEVMSDPRMSYKVSMWLCPGCNAPAIHLLQTRHDFFTSDETWVSEQWLYPRVATEAPAETPADLAKDYNEARSIEALSPQSAAALARRILQSILRDHLGAKHARLVDEIKEVGAKLPSQVQKDIDAIRLVGNYAAHPLKDDATGTVLPVEPGEAEWTLSVIDSLFDHLFVAPARAAAARASVNAKLAQAGKQALP